MVKRACKNISVLVYAPVKDDGLGQGGLFQVLLDAVTQEKYLQVKRPGVHIGIEIAQIRVIRYRFERRTPAQPRADPFGQRSFAGSDIPGDDEESCGPKLENGV
jgi:hypothetical protein